MRLYCHKLSNMKMVSTGNMLFILVSSSPVGTRAYLRSSSLPELERIATMVTHTRMTDVMRAVPKVTLTK